jgi:hypothetical protein
MDDTIAVALKVGAGRCGGFSMATATCLSRVTGVEGEINE